MIKTFKFYCDEKFKSLITYGLNIISLQLEDVKFNFHKGEGVDFEITAENFPEEFTLLENYTSPQKILKLSGTIEKSWLLNPENIVQLVIGIVHKVNAIDEYGALDKNYDSKKRYFRHDEMDNTVQKAIVSFISKYTTPVLKPSEVFVSHDIDFLYRGKYENLANAIKKLSIEDILKIIWKEWILNDPSWRNIDKILSINSEYDVRATFFWLTQKAQKNDVIKNADYNIKEELELLKIVDQAGSFNGLHKSVSENPISIELESVQGLKPYNRYHFLKFKLPEAWEDLEQAGIELDGSLGFAHKPGFRNNFGLPFKPFNFRDNKPFNLVVQPLHLMDVTFSHYLKIPVKETGNEIISFIEQNDKGCILSLLWHNNMLGGFKNKDFLPQYKKVLGYIYEKGIKGISPPEIIQRVSGIM